MARPMGHRVRSRRTGGKSPLIVVLLAGAMLVGAYVYSLLSAGPPQGRAAIFARLVDHHGREFAGDAQSREYKLVAFGYTHCPDVCPITLLRMHQVLTALGPDGGRVAPLFVTLDPVRDTPPALAQYTAAFDPRILGITGAEHDLRVLADAYGVLPADQGIAGRAATPEHSAMIYLLGRDDAMLAVYGPEEDSRAIASDVRLRALTVMRGEPAIVFVTVHNSFASAAIAAASASSMPSRKAATTSIRLMRLGGSDAFSPVATTSKEPKARLRLLSAARQLNAKQAATEINRYSTGDT